MSLIYMESFIAFGRNAADDAFNTTNGNTRKAHAANLRRAGYEVIIPDQSTAALSSGFVVRADPVVPARAAMVFSNASNGGSGFTAAIRKKTGIRDAPVIVGMSIFVPPEFVKSAVTDATPVVSFHATTETLAAATWPLFNAASYGVTAPTQIFNIGQDLQLRWGADVPQSSKALGVGRVNYIEFRISNGEVRAWIDDTLVLQKSVNLLAEAIGFTQFAQASMVGAAGRFAYSNMYILAEDVRAPNARLGPTTRVIGARPDTDVDVHFIKPSGAPSNASVSGQDLVDSPPLTLQSVTVGDQDLYATSTDTSTANGALVHAVGVKVLAANLESAPHSLRPIIRSGAAEGETLRSNTLEVRTPISTRNIFAMARRQSDGKIFAVGSGNSIYATPPNGDGTAWVTLADDGSAGICRGIIIRPDGAGVVVRDDGKTLYMAPGSDAWTLQSPAASAGFAMNAITVMTDGTFVAVGSAGRCVRTATPETPTSWVASTVNASFGIVQIDTNGTRLGCTTASNAASTVWTSDDKGATWTARSTVMPAASYQGIAFNGTSWFHCGYTTTTASDGPPLMAKSSDAITWSSPVQSVSNNTPGPQVAMAAATANRLTGEVVFVGGGGSILASSDGVAFKQLSKLTANALNCAVITASGGWLIGGNTGTLLSYKEGPIDWPLPALAGYQAAFNYSNVDPATGLPWTPAAASVSTFGMRLIS